MTDTIGAASGAVLVCAVEGKTLSTSERDFYKSVATSGVTLFGRNIPDDYHATIDLVRELQATRPAGAPPLLIAIDQEGGRVARIKGVLNPGAAQGLAGGSADAKALTAIEGIATAQAVGLSRLGINVNFAPVADVLTEPSNVAIGDRAFGTDWASVERRAGAFLDGMAKGGVLGCLKHFPGQGAAKVDTHAGRAVVDISLQQLHERELKPFAALMARAPMVMVSHCVYPALDDREASRSERVMRDLLRGELGYRGVVVSDDMNMGALPQDELAWQEAIVDAVAAGADMILVCRELERYKLAHDALQRAARKSSVFAARLTAAAALTLKLRHGISKDSAGV